MSKENSSTPHYHGHRKRLKSRFMQNTSLVPDYELVEIILSFIIPRRDVKPLAKELIEKAGSLDNILNSKLPEIKGLASQSVIFFTAIKELQNRIEKDKFITNEEVSSPQEVYNYSKNNITFGKKEFFYALFLNTANAILGCEFINKTTLNNKNLLQKEIASAAIKYNSVTIVILHHKPAKLLAPSQNDINTTKQIANALKPLDIIVVDHIIVSKNGYFSLGDYGMMPKN